MINVEEQKESLTKTSTPNEEGMEIKEEMALTDEEKTLQYLHILRIKDLNQTINYLDQETIDFQLVDINDSTQPIIGLPPIDELPPIEAEPIKPPKEKKPRPKKIKVKGCCDEIPIVIELPEEADVLQTLQYCPICQQQLDRDLEEYKGKWRWSH